MINKFVILCKVENFLQHSLILSTCKILIKNPKKYIYIIDSIIYDFNNPEIEGLLQDLLERKLPRLICEKITKTHQEKRVKQNPNIDIVNYKLNISNKSGMLLDNIYFYDTSNNNKKFLSNMNCLINNNLKQYVYRLYCYPKPSIIY